MLKDTDLNMRDLTTKLSSETSNLKSLISKPLSVYFNAYRTEDYVDGGEDYLTFQGKREKQDKQIHDDVKSNLALQSN